MQRHRTVHGRGATLLLGKRPGRLKLGEPINASGTEIWTERRWQGTDVLLIAGLGDPAEAWQPQLDGLSERYRLTAFDNPGAGRTPLPEEPLSATTMADSAAALLRTVGVRSAHVVGFSMGSAIAQEVALGHPEIVRSLVLVSTYARPDALWRSQLYFWRGWQRSRPGSAPSWRASSRGSTHRAPTRTARWVKSSRRRWASPTSSPWRPFKPKSTSAWRTTRSIASRRSVRRRSCCPASSTSSCRRASGRSVAASIPKARFEVMPGEAHQPFQEVPEEFNTRVEAFWREVEARG